VAAAGVGVEVAAHEAQFLDASTPLDDRPGDRDSGRLRELADTDEVVGIQLDDPRDEVVATLVQRLLTASSPTWCPIAEARGEKTVRSMPRSLISRS
jgi:hypothetical protein